MKIMLYKSGDAQSHKETGRKLAELPPDEYVLTIKKNRNIRSLRQNSYYHVILNIIAIHTGHDKDEIEYMFKTNKWYNIKTLPDGIEMRVPKKTSDKDTKEFAIMLNHLFQWRIDNWPELIIPERKDVDYKKWMEIENEYNTAFSGF